MQTSSKTSGTSTAIECALCENMLMSHEQAAPACRYGTISVVPGCHLVFVCTEWFALCFIDKMTIVYKRHLGAGEGGIQGSVCPAA